MKTLNTILVLSLACSPVHAGTTPPDEPSSGYDLYHSEALRLRLGGELTARNEVWDWFGKQGDAYSFRFQRSRLDFSADTHSVDVFLQPQYVSMWDLPTDASPAGRGPSGMGALYYSHNADRNTGEFI